MAAKSTKKKPSREPTTDPLGEVLGVRQAARYLGIGQRTLYAMARAGEVPHFRLGQSLRFSRSALDEWAFNKATSATERG
jgi:excisionase family DNA binding protein